MFCRIYFKFEVGCKTSFSKIKKELAYHGSQILLRAEKMLLQVEKMQKSFASDFNRRKRPKVTLWQSLNFCLAL